MICLKKWIMNSCETVQGKVGGSREGANDVVD